ncbi:MAG: pyruvate [Geobacteraceae bacterium]|nr:MAG: pyruvate [Geobacteraceae bacterium]
MSLPAHMTKLVCTIGPASETPEVMEQMLMAGMNVARINFSHGAFESHGRVIENLRSASRKTGKRLAIMADLPGPKMRIGQLAEEPVQLKPGNTFTLTTDDVVGDAARASVSFVRLPVTVTAGNTLYLNDGIIQLEVVRVRGNDVECNVVVGGELRSRKGLNIPGVDLGINAFTERDHECLRFAIENGVDAVSQSFVEKADDIEAVRRAAAALGRIPFVIAKIERTRALDRLDEIIEAADGIMIARGDLGVETPIEMIASVQKDIMHRTNLRAKPVITATQMLESMTANSRPTRAESTDVANAILDGTDCVMLSGESAMGNYPVEAVAMLAKIATSVEPHRRPLTAQKMCRGLELGKQFRPANLITIAVEECLNYITPAAVFAPTHSGATARNITRFRLPVWTVAISSQQATCQNLQFSYGVFPVHEPEHPEDWKSYVRHWLDVHKLKGDVAVVTEGPSMKHPGTNNKMEIIDLRD